METELEMITVSELANYLKCSRDTLYNLIRREKLDKPQGIFHPFPGHRGIRVNLQSFLQWRDQPKAAPLSPTELVSELLGVLMPFLTQLDTLTPSLRGVVERLQDLYESGRSGEEEHHGSVRSTNGKGK
jgi:excisionase family DNA binding protein